MTQQIVWNRPSEYRTIRNQDGSKRYEPTKRSERKLVVEGDDEAINELLAIDSVKASKFPVPKSTKQKPANCTSPEGRTYRILYTK